MAHYTKLDIIKRIEEEDIEFIRLQFTDMFGNFKNVAVTTCQLEKVLANQCTFDASFIPGFAGTDDSDMFLYPDLDTFEIFPWRPQQGKVARFICDVYRSDKSPFEGDPRYLLKKVIKEAKELGLSFDVGPECEFFLFNTEENGHPTTTTHEMGGYFDIGPIDYGENARREVVLTLEEMGFVVETSHHEAAPAQHEIDFKYDSALKTADNIMTFKLAVRTIARKHGLHATFMPKPNFGVNGSGMHVNMSLSRDGKNIFDSQEGKLGLSEEAFYFIGGLLEHVKAMAAITNPIVNSYKRLVTGFETPVYITWSAISRTQLIRIPAARGKNTRIELRNPDPSSNPYLVLAACLAAGLDGIKNHTLPADSVDSNLMTATAEQRKKLGIDRLPSSLSEAVDALEQSAFVRSVLGEHVSDRYIAAKREEWQSYSTQVTDWEIKQYLNRI